MKNTIYLNKYRIEENEFGSKLYSHLKREKKNVPKIIVLAMKDMFVISHEGMST